MFLGGISMFLLQAARSGTDP